MELSDIQKLIKEPAKLIEKIKSSRDASADAENAKAIDIENHGVMDPSVRKDRKITIDSEEEDPITGKPKAKTEYEKVYRIPSPIEKQIVTWAVQACVGNPVEISAKPENDTQESLFDMVTAVSRDNKTEFLDQEILRLTATYTCCAEFWYLDDSDPEFWNDFNISGDAKKYKPSLMILSAETGDLLYPIRNNMRKMVGLGREYIVKDDEGKDITKFDFHYDKYSVTFTQEQGDWSMANPIENKFGKAAFIFHSQPKPEWADITPKRERIESLDSDHADQNLATGSPIISVSKFKGLGKRGETGKIFELEDDGEMNMHEAAGAPESLAMERKNLLKGIFYESQTPDMSLFDAEAMGANTPGVTLKLMFTPTTMKARARHSGEFGMCYQRRLNLLKAMCTFINPAVKGAIRMPITPKFKVYMPTNETEEYDNIVKLVGAGLMSRETAVQRLAFTDDPATEYEKIKAEAAEDQANALALAQSKAPINE